MERLTYFLAALAAIVSTAPATAQSWTVGQQPVVYPLTPSTPVVGDGSNAHGGTPPAASLAAPIASNYDITQWMVPSCTTAGSTPCAASPSNGAEPKFRTHCNAAKSGWFDPILYPGQTNAGHPHLFFGNTGITKDSTYSSLRTTGGSTCGGGIINRSGYWIPGLMLGEVPNTNTANKMLKVDYAVVYYNAGDEASAKKMTGFPPGFAYVGGVDPMDTNDNHTRDLIAANNGRSGQTAVYQYFTNGTHWACADGKVQSASAPNPNASEQPYFRKKDGSWAMQCTPDSKGVVDLMMTVDMPRCWDGKNLTSPNARYHVMQPVREVNSGTIVCPNNWWILPIFELTAHYSVTNDEIASGRLYLASDRMGAQSTWTNDGGTPHNDWLGAWDQTVMNTWLSQCTGLDGIAGQPATGTTRSCIGTQYGDGRAGRTDDPAPDGSRNPQLDLTTRQITKGVYRYYPVVKPRGPVVLHSMPGM